MGKKPVIAIIGGTGQEGGGIAVRLAHADYPVVLGSRSADRAKDNAAELNAVVGNENITGAENADAAAQGDIVMLVVPFAAQRSTAQGIAEFLTGKILVDVTVPLVPPKVGRVQLPASDSAVAGLQDLLGQDVKVVSALQNVSWTHLRDLDHQVDCDVLVCGDDKTACNETIGLIEAMGMRGFYGGPVVNSVAAEALTSVLININRSHKISGAGIRITGV